MKSTSNRRKKKLDTNNNKNFCASQDTIKKVQRQPTEWVKSLSDQDSVSRICSGASLVVQCLTLSTPSAGGQGSISYAATKSLHTTTRRSHAATKNIPHDTTKKDPSCYN